MAGLAPYLVVLVYSMGCPPLPMQRSSAAATTTTATTAIAATTATTGGGGAAELRRGGKICRLFPSCPPTMTAGEFLCTMQRVGWWQYCFSDWALPSVGTGKEYISSNVLVSVPVVAFESLAYCLSDLVLLSVGTGKEYISSASSFPFPWLRWRAWPILLAIWCFLVSEQARNIFLPRPRFRSRGCVGELDSLPST